MSRVKIVLPNLAIPAHLSRRYAIHRHEYETFQYHDAFIPFNIYNIYFIDALAKTRPTPPFRLFPETRENAGDMGVH